MSYGLVVTVNADSQELTILQRNGADMLTLRVDEVEKLIADLRRGSWLAGMKTPLNPVNGSKE